MFVQMICKDRNEKEMNELYEVLGLIARREEVQIEDRYDHVDILVCPQGKIVVTEEDGDMVLRANTRHAGPGFHAFVVDIFKDIQEEVPGEYELIDDMEFDKDEDFDRLSSMYEDEMDYIRGVLLENENGKLMISKETIENLVESVARDFKDAESITTRVELDKENNVNIFANLVVSSHAVIKDLSAELQNKIKERVKKTTDLEVKEVNITVKKVASVQEQK